MKLRDDIRYAASLLDKDNQPLSIGEALLRPAKTYGVFWPHTPITDDLILKSAKTLLVSNEASLPILKIELHRGEIGLQHFQLELSFERCDQ